MYTAEEIKNMSEEELKAARKTLAKTFAKKFIIGVAIGVASHVATSLLIGAIEKKLEDTEETKEIED